MGKIGSLVILGLLLLQCSEKPKYHAGQIALSTLENFGIASEASDRVLFQEKMRAFLEAAGFELVPSRAGIPAIKAMIKAEPVLEKYGGGLEGFTGAEVVVILEYSEAESAQIDTFAGSAPPLETIGLDTTYGNPSNAPFAEAIERSRFFEGLGGVIGRHYGPAPLISAAVAKNVWVERGHLKIPFRIENYACAALRGVTGKEYGDDAEVWDMWWKRNRGADPSL